MLESAATGRYEDFDCITALALAYAGAQFAGRLERARERLLFAWRRMRPYGDTETALSELRDAGFSLIVLTNATEVTGRPRSQRPV